jgi:TonB family protein
MWRVRERVQPRPRPDDVRIVIEQPDHGGGQTIGTGTDGRPGVTDGPCRPEDGNCSTAPLPPELPAPPALPPPEDRPPPLVAPQILKGLRLRGEVAIHPPRDVYHEMFRDRNLKTSGILKVCITKTGAIASVAVAKSTGYRAYDEALVDAARRWVYKPYTVDGVPMPACSTVTFMYQMQ